MPSTVALLLTILFALFLLKKDSNWQGKTSYGLWIPCIWLLILGSRSVSQWLQLSSPVHTADALIEGNPVDRAIFLALIVIGFLILLKRRVKWLAIFRNNVWLTIFFLYCGMSILWSDFPLVASKRLFKALGDPIMVLIILTEAEPLKAIEIVIRRCFYVLVPFSILLIKYYPHLGRAYDEWTGAMFYTGVNTNKNMLGFICVVFGLFSVYRLCIDRTRMQQDVHKKSDAYWTVILLSMNLWLLWIANSKTSLFSFMLGTAVIVATGYPKIRQHFGKLLTIGLILYGALELLIDISASIVTSSGRDPTLTGRTDLWMVLMKMNSNYFIGEGFESFWLGDRLKRLWDLYYFKPNEAHNGYIDVYLNLGLIGLVLLGGMIFSFYRNIQRMLAIPSTPETVERLAFDRFRLAYLLGFIIYNVSEAGFHPLHFMFVIFLILSVQYHDPLRSMAMQPGLGALKGRHSKALNPLPIGTR